MSASLCVFRTSRGNAPDVITRLGLDPTSIRKGDDPSVSAFLGCEGRLMVMGRTAWKSGTSPCASPPERRRPRQCNRCVFVRPRVVIRPFLTTQKEAGRAPGR